MNPADSIAVVIRSFANETFRKLADRGMSLRLEDMRFEKCIFYNSVLSGTPDPELRTTVRNVTLRDCKVDPGILIGNPILEDVNVENPRISGWFMVYGAVFRRVKLSGKIGGVITLTDLTVVDESPEARATLQSANEGFYADVDDWALDISGAQFTGEFELVAEIPSHLLRINPATQAILKPERLQEVNWQSIDYGETSWDGPIHRMFNGKRESALLVASSSRHRSQELAVLEQLRELGAID